MPKNNSKKRKFNTGSALNTAHKALKIALTVKKLINVEYKSFKQDWQVDPNTTGLVTNLMGIAQGLDFDQREGRKIKLVAITIKGNVQLHASATDSTYRFTVVRDNLGKTAVPIIADLFESVQDHISNKNKRGDPQSNARFTVLADKFYIMNTNNVERHQISLYIKIASHITYTGTSATDEGKGNLYVMQSSNEGTNDPVVAIDSMIKYIDN